MHLNEFADTKAYQLTAADVTDTVNRLDAIWQGGVIYVGRPPTSCHPKQPGDRRRRLMDKWQQDRINRQSRRRRSSLR